MSFVRAALVIALLGITSSASAAAKRRHFEPDDLELEDAGTLDIDLQLGPLRGDSDGKNRVLLPDFELGLGLLPNVQLEIDGAFSLDEFDGTRRRLSGDPLWLATKLGLFDQQDEHDNVWAIGLELGPRTNHNGGFYEFGLNFHIRLPSGRTVLIDAGKLFFDDGELVFEAGKHQVQDGDVSAFCAELS